MPLTLMYAPTVAQENMSLTAWKTLAPTPKMGRRDEPTSIEVESDNEGGSPFPAQCTFDIVEEFAPVQHIHHRRTSTIAAHPPSPRIHHRRACPTAAHAPFLACPMALSVPSQAHALPAAHTHPRATR